MTFCPLDGILLAHGNCFSPLCTLRENLGLWSFWLVCVLAHFLMLAHICSRLIAELSACDRAWPTRPEAAQWYATNADPFSLTWPAGGSNMQA
jgi:hypothetical protein